MTEPTVDFIATMEIRESIRRIERKIEDCAKADLERRGDLTLMIDGWKKLLAERMHPPAIAKRAAR
jgi:hypothetical protein